VLSLSVQKWDTMRISPVGRFRLLAAHFTPVQNGHMKRRRRAFVVININPASLGRRNVHGLPAITDAEDTITCW